jgi:hypothetical protein
VSHSMILKECECELLSVDRAIASAIAIAACNYQYDCDMVNVLYSLACYYIACLRKCST